MSVHKRMGECEAEQIDVSKSVMAVELFVIHFVCKQQKSLLKV